MQGLKDAELIYYPDDTHWNELWMFLIHAEIIETLLPELPLEDYLVAEDFSRRTVSRVGDLSLLLGLDQFQSISTNWFPVDEWLIIEEACRWHRGGGKSRRQDRSNHSDLV